MTRRQIYWMKGQKQTVCVIYLQYCLESVVYRTHKARARAGKTRVRAYLLLILETIDL